MHRSLKILLTICFILLCYKDLTHAVNYAPTRVAFLPYELRISEETEVPPIVRYLSRNQHINLLCLSPPLLASLSKLQLKDLLIYLSRYKVKLRWLEDEQYRSPSKIKSNAATALLLKVVNEVNNRSNLAAKMLAAAPSELLRGLRSSTGNVLSAELIARTLNIMFAGLVTEDPMRVTAQSNTIIIRDAAYLSSVYVKYWAKKDPKKIEHYLKEISKISAYGCLPYEKAGALIGSVLAGVMTHVGEIETQEIRRAILYNLIGDLTVAGLGTLGLMGLSPLVAMQAMEIVLPVVTGVPAKILTSIPAFRLNDKYLKCLVKVVQGHIELFMLQHVTPDNKHKVHLMSMWMSTALHINGHCD